MIEHYFSIVLTERQREVITLAFEGRAKQPTISTTDYLPLLSSEGEPGELFLTPAEVSFVPQPPSSLTALPPPRLLVGADVC
jgi:hypothetical protein